MWSGEKRGEQPVECGWFVREEGFIPDIHEQLHRITEDQIRYLRERLAARDLGLTLTPAAIDKLAEAGFDPAHGAHPRKRAVQPQIENPLAQEIIAGDTIRVDINDDVINLRQGISAQRREIRDNAGSSE
jgi:ATP-dependent Clp protease ATP-binding subunit ClpB